MPGLLVALGAAVATAHGLYEVAGAAGAPEPIAWLYPLITDGLALVAYATTTRLTGQGRRYAWSVVVLAAGLSGLAQATYLAGGVDSAPLVLRFGVGAWPAVAAAIVAHLLFLLGTYRPADGVDRVERPAAVQPQCSSNSLDTGRPAVPVAVRQVTTAPVESLPGRDPARRSGVEERPAALDGAATRTTAAPARDRARAAARRFASRHGRLPTVSELTALADVARGTAGTALQDLRHQPTALHVVDEHAETGTTP